MYLPNLDVLYQGILEKERKFISEMVGDTMCFYESLLSVLNMARCNEELYTDGVGKCPVLFLVSVCNMEIDKNT